MPRTVEVRTCFNERGRCAKLCRFSRIAATECRPTVRCKHAGLTGEEPKCGQKRCESFARTTGPGSEDGCELCLCACSGASPCRQASGCNPTKTKMPSSVREGPGENTSEGEPLAADFAARKGRERLRKKRNIGLAAASSMRRSSPSGPMDRNATTPAALSPSPRSHIWTASHSHPRSAEQVENTRLPPPAMLSAFLRLLRSPVVLLVSGQKERKASIDVDEVRSSSCLLRSSAAH